MSDVFKPSVIVAGLLLAAVVGALFFAAGRSDGDWFLGSPRLGGLVGSIATYPLEVCTDRDGCRMADVAILDVPPAGARRLSQFDLRELGLDVPFGAYMDVNGVLVFVR